MTKRVFKRKKPAQEKLKNIFPIVLRDSLSGNKSILELAKNYNVNYQTLRIFYRNNNIKKKRKYVARERAKGSRYSSEFKKNMEDLKNYIKENNITKEDIKLAILSMNPKKDILQRRNGGQNSINRGKSKRLEKEKKEN